MTEQTKTRPAGERTQTLPVDQLTEELRNLAEALGERLLSSATEKLGGLTGRLTDYVDNGDGGVASLIGSVVGSRHPVATGLKEVAKTAAGGLFQKVTGGGKGGRGKKLKLTNIVETLDVGAPLRLVYDQWTQFEDFPGFTKKVEGVHQEAEGKLSWKAQVFWSHRTWESTIVEQIPDRRIIWRSKGAKGHVDGAVTFHALGPDLTRVLLVLEYHPQGLFERTGNLWRAQGRRARLELKHFRRHVMTQALLHPDDIEGWRGEIRDSKVVKDHETALREEEARESEAQEEEEEQREPASERGGREEPEVPAQVRRPVRRRRAEAEEPEEPEEADEADEADEVDEAEATTPRRPVRRRRTVDAETAVGAETVDTETTDTETQEAPRPVRRRATARST
ncbi:SRPBCC family protein [Streptosporangium algeriense]|uniref:SRPBCC family protein n=1 Tax=Streptosporangium algeriense TaxID=1682748 RepID=A0ABW3DRC6_9ACTN